MKPLIVLVALLLSGCGSSSPTLSPSPVPRPTAPTTPIPPPTPSRITVTGTLTATLSGTTVGTFSQEVAALPAFLTLSQAGFVTRQTWVRSTTPTVDLIAEAGGFDLDFYRQFARDNFDRQRGGMEPLWVLQVAPSFYMEVEGAKGLSASVAARLERVARRVVPQLTGGRYQLARWETGPTPRAPQAGWIMIERRDEPDNVCGRALVGASAGQVWLDANQRCRIEAVFAHELGHAFGFFHVGRAGSVMFPFEQSAGPSTDAFTEMEQRHAAVAYARPRGNRDLDVDPQASQAFSLAPMVVD